MLQQGERIDRATIGREAFQGLPQHLATLAESGLSEFELTAWVALFVPAKTPRDPIDKLNSYANAFLKDPATVKHLATMSAIPFATSPEQLGTFADADTKRWARIVEVAKIERQ